MKKIKIRTNLVSGLVFLAAAVALLLIIPREIVQTYRQNQYIDADTIPKMIGYLMLILSIWLLVKGTVLHKEVIKEFELRAEAAATLFIVVLAVYLMLIPRLGFLVSSLLLAVATMAYQKVRSVKQWVVVLLFVVLIYVAFAFGLQLSFPGFMY